MQQLMATVGQQAMQRAQFLQNLHQPLPTADLVLGSLASARRLQALHNENI